MRFILEKAKFKKKKLVETKWTFEIRSKTKKTERNKKGEMSVGPSLRASRHFVPGDLANLHLRQVFFFF